jgi:type IV pilus assembly protein PilA
VLRALLFLACPLGAIALVSGAIMLLSGRPARAVARTMLASGAALVALSCAVLVPNFFEFEVRSKQSECKANLKRAIVAETAFFSANGRYSEHPEEVGFKLEYPRNRYLIEFAAAGSLGSFDHIGPDDVGTRADTEVFTAYRRDGSWIDTTNDSLRAAIPPALQNELGVHGDCAHRCSVTIACAGQIDIDDTVDVWSVSTDERKRGGRVVPAGVPFNDVDDVVH